MAVLIGGACFLMGMVFFGFAMDFPFKQIRRWRRDDWLDELKNMERQRAERIALLEPALAPEAIDWKIPLPTIEEIDADPAIRTNPWEDAVLFKENLNRLEIYRKASVKTISRPPWEVR